MVTTWSLPGHSARQTPEWSSIGHPGVTGTDCLHNSPSGLHKSWIARHLGSVASFPLPAVGLPSDLAKGPLFSGTNYRRFISRFRAMAAKWEQHVPSSTKGSSPGECFWRETGLSLRSDPEATPSTLPVGSTNAWLPRECDHALVLGLPNDRHPAGRDTLADSSPAGVSCAGGPMRVIGQDGQQGFSVSYWQPAICGATDAGGRAGAKQFPEVSVGPQSFPPSDRSERSFLHWQVNGRAGESSPDERRAVGDLEEGGVTPVEVKHQLAPGADDGQGLHARYTGCRIE